MYIYIRSVRFKYPSNRKKIVLATKMTEAVIISPTKNITAKMPVQKPHSLNMLSISASLLNLKQYKDLLFIIMDSNSKSKLISSRHCDKCMECEVISLHQNSFLRRKSHVKFIFRREMALKT